MTDGRGEVRAQRPQCLVAMVGVAVQVGEDYVYTFN